MLRKLIALLVLVTGLAAAGTPAQARIFDVETVRSAVDAGYACTVPVGVREDGLATRKDRGDSEQKVCPRPPRIVVVVPTVMLRTDRARE